jgi:hypothetical protein
MAWLASNHSEEAVVRRCGGLLRLWPALLASLLPVTLSPMLAQVTVKVYTQSPVYTMKGGLGASWHALRVEPAYQDPDWDFPAKNGDPRGSAIHGNPPFADERAWRQLCGQASWLGLNFVRVELSQLMYEPGKGKFSWDNEEMLTLYRILDWCQQNQVDVFLQQQWTEVEWNSYPGVQPLISAPRSLSDHAEGLATLVDYLVKNRNYSCIRWICIANEPPGGTWGYWWSTGSYPCVPFPEALKAARAAFDQHKINVPISGPDWTDLPVFDEKKIDFDECLGAYDVHSYQGMDANRAEILGRWVAWAHARNKPCFLSEFGDMRLGWGKANPGPASFAASLSNAETVLRGIRVDADGFNRWSFVNRGDIDGQWQLVRTYDIGKKQYREDVTPEPAAYYGYGILTRFLSKHSTRLKDDVTGVVAPFDSFVTVTMKSPAGNLTTYLLNLGTPHVQASVQFDGLPRDLELNVYQITEALVAAADYRMDPMRQITLNPRNPGLNEDLPPRSITVLTTYKLRHTENGIGSDSRE